jgi:hypothetical protein
MSAFANHRLQGANPAKLSWSSILYSAALSAVVAGAALTALARPRQPAVILTGALATAAGPLVWNATLRATHASQSLPTPAAPAARAAGKTPARACSPLAVTAVLLGFGLLAFASARRTIPLAVLCGVAAFLVDIYLYRPGLDAYHLDRAGGDATAS